LEKSEGAGPVKKLVLIGAGGHAKSCIDVIETQGIYQIIGFLDLPEKDCTRLLDYPKLGSDDLIPELAKDQNHFFLVAVGQILSPENRTRIYGMIKKAGGQLATVLSPLAHISKHAKIGEGTVVMHHAMVNANVDIGVNCIINSKALIEHDCVVKDFCHVSTGALVNGNVIIHPGTFIGSGAVLSNGLEIKEFSVVHLGAIVKSRSDCVITKTHAEL